MLYENHLTTSLQIINPGISTTVQDRGRFGFRSQGVSPCGAMDHWSFCLLNQDAHTPTLEVEGGGLELLVNGELMFAVVGGMPHLLLNQTPLPHGRVYWARTGDKIHIPYLRKGIRTYFGVFGGFRVPKVMGSASTDRKAKIGRPPLSRGDTLECSAPKAPVGLVARSIPSPLWNIPEEVQSIRVIRGVDLHRFPRRSVRSFFRQPFQITDRIDRTGYTLRGEQPIRIKRKEFLSEGIAFGTIQVPPSGTPIICMADAPSSGGYPRIAQVIQADCSLIAQMKPGQKIVFHAVRLEDALSINKEREIQKAILQKSWKRDIPDAKRYARWFRLLCDGKFYELGIQRIDPKRGGS